MNHYYFAEDNQQFGPFSLEELKKEKIKKSTLIWTEGMSNWLRADTIDELKDILIPEPPPLPIIESNQIINNSKSNKISKINESSKYDLTYSKESIATIVGLLFFIVPIILIITKLLTFATVEEYVIVRIIILISALILRIFVIIWIQNIASRQNRNTTGWGWFAFFMPSLALIFIGQLKKLRLEIKVDTNLPLDEQVDYLYDKANQLFSGKRYLECIESLNTAIDLMANEYKLVLLRAISYYSMKDYEKSLADFDILDREGQFISETNYYRGNIAIMKFDREAAVKFWLISKQIDNNKEVQIQLFMFHDFIGKFILSKEQSQRKLTSDSKEKPLSLTETAYIGGLQEIDEKLKLYDSWTQIFVYKNGIEIEINANTSQKQYIVAISFFEMTDITFEEFDKEIKIHLRDFNVVAFYYDRSLDLGWFNNNLCEMYENSTGKMATAASLI